MPIHQPSHGHLDVRKYGLPEECPWLSHPNPWDCLYVAESAVMIALYLESASKGTAILDAVPNSDRKHQLLEGGPRSSHNILMAILDDHMSNRNTCHIDFIPYLHSSSFTRSDQHQPISFQSWILSLIFIDTHIHRLPWVKY